MSNTFSRFSAVAFLLLFFMAACNKDATFSNNPNMLGTEFSAVGNGAVLLPKVAEGKYIKDAYIVVLKDDVANVDAEVDQMVRGLGGSKPDHVYKHAIKGFSIKVPEAAVKGLLKNPKVKYIEQDQEVTAIATQSDATWGLDRVDQRALPLSTTYSFSAEGSGVDAYIFDTGILFGHREFGGRAKNGYDVFGGNGNDQNGHGTHVAGTVGGATYGIAKKVNLIAVRVLDRRGSGSLSGIIAGINWAVNDHNTKTSKNPSVGNMSLGSSHAKSVNEAVASAIKQGMVICVAAGNSSADAADYSPASTPSAITVGATTSSDIRASYSNYGSLLDLFAPGSSITSAWHTSTSAINTISGTSMASPHVAGVVALYLEGNRSASPDAVALALLGDATKGVVGSPGAGSPNLLLYVGTGSDDEVTTDPPPTTSLSETTLVSPRDKSSVSRSATLTWSSTGASSHDVYVSTSQSFSSPLATVTGTSITVSGLKRGTTYYWKVRSRASDGVTTKESAIWSFTSK